LGVATSFSKEPADEFTEAEIDAAVASAKFNFNVTPNIPGDYEMVAIGQRETCKKIIIAYLEGLLKQDTFQIKLWEAAAQQHSIVMAQFREEYPQFMQATMILDAPSPYVPDTMRYCYNKCDDPCSELFYETSAHRPPLVASSVLRGSVCFENIIHLNWAFRAHSNKGIIGI
jgi:hypothetical protein